MAKVYRWTLVHHARAGHRFFRDENTGRIACADDSGSYPHDTEDGVLWLDLSRDLRVDSESGHVSVPLARGVEQDSISTVENIRELPRLVEMWGRDVVWFGKTPCRVQKIHIESMNDGT